MVAHDGVKYEMPALSASFACVSGSGSGSSLRAMAREDAPRDLAPLEFWQDTLQACGYNLEEVISTWESARRGVRNTVSTQATLPVGAQR